MQDDNPNAAAPVAPPKLLTMAEFLETKPPDATEEVSDLTRIGYNRNLYLNTPDLNLHCDVCDGIRIFHCGNDPYISGDSEFEIVTYTCRNCQRASKTFALALENGKKSKRVQKLGELPPFGPPTPPRLIQLVGADRELFLQGRRAEFRGFGIGAFAYYRRVVEEQKGRIIDQIGKVADKLGASNQTMQLFAEAISETQFSAAIDKIRQAIPPSLLIDGHNPLKLLHSALSDGLHAKTDEECLELATSIRLVLSELAERTSAALKEEAELKTAVKRLLNKKANAQGK